MPPDGEREHHRERAVDGADSEDKGDQGCHKIFTLTTFLPSRD